jgi:hypothetical protein
VNPGATHRRAGSPVFPGVYRCELVGRTGFEPVTSSVSGKSRTVPGVCHRRVRSNGEPRAWSKVLAALRWVWRRLIALAPISGSQRSAVSSGVGCRATAQVMPPVSRWVLVSGGLTTCRHSRVPVSPPALCSAVDDVLR